MGALDGFRVLDLSQIVQGPQAGALLADLGADVVKIELPRLGDISRWIPISSADRRSAYFFACNRGKRSVTLDLHVPEARAALLRLCETADVLMHSFTPGVMERWELGYEQIAPRLPRLVYATASAFGPAGPDAEREGADLAGQAAGGLIRATGEDGDFPSPVGAVVADHCGSQNLVAGILAALLARERTGRGQRVDVSLLGGQVWAQASEITHYLLSGSLPGRANRGHGLLPTLYRIFATADGHLAIVGAGGALWPGFCRALDRPDLIDDSRFADEAERGRHLPELVAAVAEQLATRTTAAWCDRLRAEQQRYAPVRDYAELAADPQLWANGYLVEVEHPQFGRQRIVGTPVRFSDTPSRPGTAAPELGQHTEAVLLDAGFTWDEIAALREEGAW
ncbi:MAG TPA: CoA transferase [Dehalococcoidia bacterium]|nr:CoA transferase [Dehalococcoidia bacterium]